MHIVPDLIASLATSAPGFFLEQSTPTILTGISAYKIVFRQTEGQLPLKTMEVWMIKDNKAYIIEYGAEVAKYSTYLPVVQKMIDSFELINST